MLVFPDPDTALKALGRLLPACRKEQAIPLTRSGLNHGQVIHRSGDVFGTTVNVAARITAFASPGQVLASEVIADTASESGIAIDALGPVALRSFAQKVPLFSIQLAEAVDPAWIDPVCKMHAPYAAFIKERREGPWFCSKRCEEAYLKSPETYATDR